MSSFRPFDCPLCIPGKRTELVGQPVLVLALSLCDPGHVPNLPEIVENGKGLDGSQSSLPVLIACELYVLWILFPFIHWGGGRGVGLFLSP